MSIKTLKNWLKSRKKAETLLEVTIAVGIVAMGAATAAHLIVTSLRANQYNKETLQALNLAQEGIEYMHNLRDTNWIKFSSNTEDCWNILPEKAQCDRATTTDFIQGGNYLLAEKLVSKTGADLDIGDDQGVDGQDAAFRLAYYDINKTIDSDGDGEKENDLDMILGQDSSNSYTKVTDAQFYRSINLEYKAINDAGAITDSDWDAGNMMVITVKVQWRSFGRVQTIELSSALSRYR